MANFDTFTLCANHVNRDGLVGLPDVFSDSALSFLGDTSLSQRVRSSIRSDACFSFFWLGRLGRSGGWSECLAQTFTRILEWTSGLGVVREVGA